MKTILVDAVDTFVIEGEGINKPMYKMLEEYPNKKIVLTNANKEEIKKFDLGSIPYELFTLKHNPNKTDPEYYRIMLKNLNLTKNNVVYFEHNKDAVESARSVGIKTYYYESDKNDLKSLKDFLNNNL